MTFKQLSWGVKESFRGYVEAMEGSITCDEGANQVDSGVFTFDAAPGGDLHFADDGTASGTLHLNGSVTFEAHGGMLKSTLAELRLEAQEAGLFITVLEAPMNQSRCAIAQLYLEETNDNGVTLRCEITVDGMYQIADNYPPGTELDQVQLARG